MINSNGVWLVTGCAGFIGSHIIETLLKTGKHVIGVDNFATGSKTNLDQVKESVGADWKHFRFIEADIRNFESVKKVFALDKIDYVLHQAALGSVTRSIKDPQATHDTNVNGFLNVLLASRDAGVKKFVYASSSSVYGDHADLPKKEGIIGAPLSPYAVTKLVNEQYAAVFSKTYGLATVGLRYFNVFGPRQDPEGPYAAVVPLWISQLLSGEPVSINGDGLTSRDFCYVRNAVQANIKAALCSDDGGGGGDGSRVYNVALGHQTSLVELFEMIKMNVSVVRPSVARTQVDYKEYRAGDVRHSLADISRAQKEIGYVPEVFVKEGLEETIKWYVTNAE